MHVIEPEDPGSFRGVAPYYDELMSAVPYRMWVGYYLLLLSQQSVRPKRLLDVCCGTGTMAAMLCDEGFEVDGIDLAPGMIASARRKASRRKSRSRFEVADAADFELGETYDAALSFFDSLNNILDPSRLQSAFDCVYNHLNPGGSWVFDLNTAYAFEERLFDQENVKPGAKLRYKWVGDYDPGLRIITVRMHFWHGGKEFDEVHRQFAYRRDEVEGMLVKSGFVNVKAYHSYTLDPPRAKSDRIHYTALKPG